MTINRASLVSAYDEFMKLPDNNAKENFLKTHWLHNDGHVSKKNSIANAIAKRCSLFSKIHHFIFGISNTIPFNFADAFTDERNKFAKDLKVSCQNRDYNQFKFNLDALIYVDKSRCMTLLFCLNIINNKDKATFAKTNNDLNEDLKKSLPLLNGEILIAATPPQAIDFDAFLKT